MFRPPLIALVMALVFLLPAAPTLVAHTPPETRLTVVPFGSVWKYAPDPSNDPAHLPWEFAYDDGPWPSGPGSFGSDCATTKVPDWNEPEGLYLRATIELPANLVRTEVAVRSLNVVKMYANAADGPDFSPSAPDACPDGRSSVRTVPTTQLHPGTNLVMFVAYSTAGIDEFPLGYLVDMEIVAIVQEPPEEHELGCAASICVRVLHQTKVSDLATAFGVADAHQLQVERGVLTFSPDGDQFFALDLLVPRRNGQPDPAALDQQVAGASTSYEGGELAMELDMVPGPGPAVKIGELWESRLRHYVDGQLRSDVSVLHVELTAP